MHTSKTFTASRILFGACSKAKVRKNNREKGVNHHQYSNLMFALKIRPILKIELLRIVFIELSQLRIHNLSRNRVMEMVSFIVHWPIIYPEV